MAHPSVFKRISTRLYYFLKYQNPLIKRVNKLQEKKFIKEFEAKVQDKNISILSLSDTIEEIIKNRKSIARFGDGELRLMLPNENLYFQNTDRELIKKLRETLNSKADNILIALNKRVLSLEGLSNEDELNWWIGFLKKYGVEIIDMLPSNKVYSDAGISRFYMGVSDRKFSENMVSHLKKIWENKDILFIEGQYSRLGVGNDLFNNASSVKRIIAPSKNAFDKYSDILDSAMNYGRNKLIILSLGPTATALAYDLAKEGLWALDLGHFDVEYMWMQMGAKERVPIPGRTVSEAKDRATETLDLDAKSMKIYTESIIQTIL